MILCAEPVLLDEESLPLLPDEDPLDDEELAEGDLGRVGSGIR